MPKLFPSLFCGLFIGFYLFAGDQARSSVRVACVGDSITYGAGLSGRETNSYPAQLGRLLGANYDTRNFGVSGATMLRHGDLPYMLRGEYTNALDFAPDIVVILAARLFCGNGSTLCYVARGPIQQRKSGLRWET